MKIWISRSQTTQKIKIRFRDLVCDFNQIEEREEKERCVINAKQKTQTLFQSSNLLRS